jgi:TolA-binding protein
VESLQQQQAASQAKVAALSNKVVQAREDDLNREALALNRGGKAPKPKEPELQEQLESAQRELEVLERRLTLAGSDRSRYIQEKSEELMGLLAGAQAAEGASVAEGAAKVLADLLRYYKCEDDARAMRRLIPAPASLEENAGEPQKSVTVWGPMTTQNVTGGPARGDLEGALRHLASLGGARQAETIVGDASEATA